MFTETRMTDGTYAFDAETGVLKYRSHCASQRRFRVDCWKTHCSFGVYGIPEALADCRTLSHQILLNEVNRRFFDNEGGICDVITKDAYGSGVVASEGHCICHTFSERGLMLVDFCHLDDIDTTAITGTLLEMFGLLYRCERVELTMGARETLKLLKSEKQPGYLGRQVTIGLPSMAIVQGERLLEQIRVMIRMGSKRIYRERRSLYPARHSVLDLTASCHAAIHTVGGVGMLDVFSCQPFSLDKVLDLLRKSDAKIGEIRDVYCGIHLV